MDCGLRGAEDGYRCSRGCHGSHESQLDRIFRQRRTVRFRTGLRQLWTTPHGVVKAAMANGGKIDGKVIAFKLDGREIKAMLNDQNLIQKVSFLGTNEVIGDYTDEIAYSDYVDFGGIKFPTHIVETQADFPVLDVKITEVKPNVAVSLNVPENVAQAAAPTAKPSVNVQKLADGVLYMTAAGVSSWAVEFK